MLFATKPPPGHASQGWARFLAKWVDSLFVGLLCLALVLLLPDTLASWRDLVASFGWLAAMVINRLAIIAIFVLFDAILLSAFGASPGRALLGLKVLQEKTGRPPTFDQAMWRTIKLWIMGMGLALPVISFLTVGAAWFGLLKTGITSWDDGSGLKVEHRPVHPVRWWLAIAVFLCLIVGQTLLAMFSFTGALSEPIAPG